MRKPMSDKDTSSEIEKIVAMAKRMTPDELSSSIRSKFRKDLQLFKRLVTEQREKTERIRNIPEIKGLLKKVESFYENLIADGYVKKDLSLLKGSNLESYKISQAREEATSIFKELRNTKNVHYKETFRKLNRVYVINYETLIDSYLVEVAQKILGRQVKSKGEALATILSYREGKHKELFRCLIPQIRNSIQHSDLLINPKKPKITFYDRTGRKPPLELSLDEYAEIFWESFYLVLAFDITDLDLMSTILNIFIEAIDVVDTFLKKHDLKLVKDEFAPSLMDWAVLIKSGKIPKDFVKVSGKVEKK